MYIAYIDTSINLGNIRLRFEINRVNLQKLGCPDSFVAVRPFWILKLARLNHCRYRNSAFRNSKLGPLAIA